MRHLLSVDDLTQFDIDRIFHHAAAYAELGDQRGHRLKNKTLGCLFFEPSTRTRWSTEAAMQNLGGNVLSMECAKMSSSDKKGESLADTFKTCSQYADILAVRHPEEGSIQKAAQFSDVPVINCGDGSNEHPTQALLDLFTIKRKFSELKGLKVMFTGDLECSRTIHSLTKLFVNYGIETSDEISTVDVLYMTRFQTERDKPRNKSDFVMTSELANMMKSDSIIMHPLPRTDELLPEVDSNHRAFYFKQAKNGLFVRMAILRHLLR